MIVMNSQVRISYLGPALSPSEIHLLWERRAGRGKLRKWGAFWVDKQTGQPKDRAQRGATQGGRVLESEKRQQFLLMHIKSPRAEKGRVARDRIQWGSVKNALQRSLEESPRWEEWVFRVARLAWGVNAPSSFIPGIFFFSSLGGRGNCKSVHFSVQLPWIPEVECIVGVWWQTYRRHWGAKGEGDMPLYSVLWVDRHVEPPVQCDECFPNSRSVQGVLGRIGLGLILFLLRTK